MYLSWEILWFSFSREYISCCLLICSWKGNLGSYRNPYRILTNLHVFSDTPFFCFWQYLGLPILESLWGSILWISLANLFVKPKSFSFVCSSKLVVTPQSYKIMNTLCLLFPTLPSSSSWWVYYHFYSYNFSGVWGRIRDKNLPFNIPYFDSLFPLDLFKNTNQVMIHFLWSDIECTYISINSEVSY